MLCAFLWNLNIVRILDLTLKSSEIERAGLLLNDKQRSDYENPGSGKLYRNMTQFFIKLIIREKASWSSDLGCQMMLKN